MAITNPTFTIANPAVGYVTRLCHYRTPLVICIYIPVFYPDPLYGVNGFKIYF
jgi:hypothetical protein